MQIAVFTGDLHDISGGYNRVLNARYFILFYFILRAIGGERGKIKLRLVDYVSAGGCRYTSFVKIDQGQKMRRST